MPTTQEWIDELKSISVLELAERIKALEEEFGVSAAAVAAPVAAAGAGAPGADGAEAVAEESATVDVVLQAAGDKKIQVIKEVRGLTNLGLKEAKDLVDNAPKPVLERVPKEQADSAREKLEGAGATVEVK